MAKKTRLASILEDAAKDPAVRAVAASTAVAGGAIAGKLVHDRMEESQRRQERRFRLSREQPPATEIQRVVAGQLAEAIELLGANQSGHLPKVVHDARKALKRSRAALRLGRDLLGPRRYRRENLALRDAGRRLSDLRDSQVLVETLDGMAATDSFARFRAGLAQPTPGNGGAPDSVPDTIRDSRARVLRWRLASSPEAEAEALAAGFTRIYRRGRRALKAAERDPNVENLHELRKRAKDLWHAAQLLRDWDPVRTRDMAKRAHELSDLLGSEHDLAVLEQRVESDTDRLTSDEREQLQRLIARRRKRLRRQALDCAARVYRRKPAKIARRLSLA